MANIPTVGFLYLKLSGNLTNAHAVLIKITDQIYFVISQLSAMMTFSNTLAVFVKANNHASFLNELNHYAASFPLS
jgi:hypothetical protein